MDIIAFLIGIVILIVVLKLISLPFKIIIKFVINSIIGGVILFGLTYFGIKITIYWWTLVLTGLFGIPGLICAVLIGFLI